MLKEIIKINGVKVLNKKEQLEIKGAFNGNINCNIGSAIINCFSDTDCITEDCTGYCSTSETDGISGTCLFPVG
ncbi:hypothetical protein GTQ40_10615 [Flavobacteriaceae bacterium R38]|nr:hypothetical protein [Flavobacteriaceae bacterium R38]